VATPISRASEALDRMAVAHVAMSGERCYDNGARPILICALAPRMAAVDCPVQQHAQP
jgi:hypothetical protein